MRLLPQAHWAGMAAVVRLSFARGARARRLHLGRFVLLALFAGIVSFSFLAAEGEPVDTLDSREPFAAVLSVLVFLLGIVLAGGAGAEFAGPERERAVALLALSRLGPGELVFGSWVGRLGWLAALLAGLLPIFGALTLVGGLDVDALAFGALAFAESAMLVTALGLALSSGARSALQGTAHLVLLMLGAVVVAIAVVALWGADVLEELVRAGFVFLPVAPLVWAFEGPTGNAHEWWPSVAISVVGSFALLRFARARLLRRHSARPGRIDTGLDKARSRPVAGPPLDWLGTAPLSRMRRVAHAATSGLLALLVLVWLCVAGVARTAEADFLLAAGCVVVILAGLFALGGAISFWSRLRAGGLLVPLLATPLGPAAFVRASLHASWLLSRPLVLLLLLLMPLLAVLNERPLLEASPGILVALLSLALLAVAGSYDGVVAERPGRRAQVRSLSFLLLTFVATFSWIGARMFCHEPGPWEGAGRAIAVLLFVALPLAAVLAGRNHARFLLLSPMLLIATVLPAFSALVEHAEIGFALNPVATLIAGYSIGTGVEWASGDLAFVALSAMLLAVALVGLGWWLTRNIDRALGRLP